MRENLVRFYADQGQSDELIRACQEALRIDPDWIWMLQALALAYALKYGRDLDAAKADQFVGMYVNDWTLDCGPRGRESVQLLLKRGFEAGVIPTLVEAEFVSSHP